MTGEALYSDFKSYWMYRINCPTSAVIWANLLIPEDCVYSLEKDLGAVRFVPHTSVIKTHKEIHYFNLYNFDSLSGRFQLLVDILLVCVLRSATPRRSVHLICLAEHLTLLSYFYLMFLFFFQILHRTFN